jgi:hypothetical protein
MNVHSGNIPIHIFAKPGASFIDGVIVCRDSIQLHLLKLPASFCPVAPLYKIATYELQTKVTRSTLAA